MSTGTRKERRVRSLAWMRAATCIALVALLIAVLPGTALAVMVDSGFVEVWGRDTWEQTDKPPGIETIAVSGGYDYSLGLRADGSIYHWGRSDNYGQDIVPAGNDFVAVAAGNGNCLALKDDGSLVAWGRNDQTQLVDTPSGNDFVAVSAGGAGFIALKSDGTFAQWGANAYGELENPPTGNDFVAVDSGRLSSVALRADGTLEAWGTYDYSLVNAVPTGDGFVAVSLGHRHGIALKDNGSIVAWGNNNYGQGVPPTDNSGFVAIEAGGYFNVGLKADGSIVTWGEQIGEAPAGNDFMAISAGGAHALALTRFSDSSIGVDLGPQAARTTLPVAIRVQPAIQMETNLEYLEYNNANPLNDSAVAFEFDWTIRSNVPWWKRIEVTPLGLGEYDEQEHTWLSPPGEGYMFNSFAVGPDGRPNGIEPKFLNDEIDADRINLTVDGQEVDSPWWSDVIGDADNHEDTELVGYGLDINWCDTAGWYGGYIWLSAYQN